MKWQRNHVENNEQMVMPYRRGYHHSTAIYDMNATEMYTIFKSFESEAIVNNNIDGKNCDECSIK